MKYEGRRNILSCSESTIVLRVEKLYSESSLSDVYWCCGEWEWGCVERRGVDVQAIGSAGLHQMSKNLKRSRLSNRKGYI